ncbi:DUF1318 domain-containing protein [Aliidiomarina sanyensis]|uniref:DUF1318 domain-containing protein n=1 Tax=Aliidiomarina sanyensis TaxID=1249555 RepID=A0A432WRA0_9GAMM|nr:DUF1318 domain-containing protein [Aliidiomarina sanyensis]RUO36291.1 DUF1318 domain-containing protein [Aliidiomarina sanyensis]
MKKQMKRAICSLTLLLLITGTTSLIAEPAAAGQQSQTTITMQDASHLIREYKERGLLGETQTGYVGVVRDEEHAVEVARLVNEVRREEFVRLAAEHNVSVMEIEAMAGQRSIHNTRSGHFIQIDGEWVRKP